MKGGSRYSNRLLKNYYARFEGVKFSLKMLIYTPKTALFRMNLPTQTVAHYVFQHPAKRC